MTLVTIVLIPLHQREMDKRRNVVSRKKKYVGELKQSSGPYETVSSQRPSGRHETVASQRPSGRHASVRSSDRHAPVRPSGRHAPVAVKRPSERLAAVGKKKPSGRHSTVASKHPSGRHHVVALKKKPQEEITIIPPQLSEIGDEGGLPWMRAESHSGGRFRAI